MYWKALRLGADANEPKRQSTVNLSIQSRHSEHIPRPNLSTSQLASRRSESTPRPPFETDTNDVRPTTPERSNRDGPDGAHSGKAEASTSPVQQQTPRRNRFSLMRFRHASDPQLSTSYVRADEDVPPVPPMPPPPTIITTAPTNHNLERPVKRKNKMKLIPRSKKSSLEEIALNANNGSNTRNMRTAHSVTGSTDSQIADSSLGTSHASHEEPGRLSITSLRSGGRGHATDSNRSSIPDARFSESSPSDASSGDQRIYRTTSRNDDSEPSASSKLFRLPRLKKSRGPFFPLPLKMTPAESSNAQSVNDKASCPPASGPVPTGMAPKAVAAIRPDQDQLTPLPSPTHSSVGLSSPRASAPPLFRKDSTTSARSAKSSSSIKAKKRPTRRGRSSTMGSLIDMRDDQQQPSSHLASSGRTSTSTSGRKSFGDLFNLSQRLRHNSEPPIPQNSSPSLVGPGTPASFSKPGSFSLTREALPCPEREEGDTPATYLSRLEEGIHRGAIAGILSQSNDDFFKTALRRYMRGFSFFGDPMDMAIRKLLMEVELPKETQQIDRVLQSFADRYHECNPGIFASTDQAYFIAFSILILHTDVFNKNNKRKMQKHDYVKNTRGESIADEVLECFYENISYTPFIHVEDDVNLSGRHLPKPRKTLFKTASSDHLTRVSREPVDPYALILDGKLDTLRPTLKDVMNLEDTYSCVGSGGAPDMDSLHQAFSRSAVLQIVSARSRPDAFMTPSSIDNPIDSHPGLVDIKVAKVGLLWRKDSKKKKARSPWQEWGALLTFSQLYLFKDVNWAKSLMSQYDSQQKHACGRPVVFTPPLTEFKPDSIMSTDDAVALLDSNYKKHKHAFLLIRHNALEETFLANDEADMNDWVAKLNYAAALRTTGVRMKGMTGTSYEDQRRRVSRMDSITSDASIHSADAGATPATNADSHLADEVSAARKQLMTQRIREANEKLFICQRQLDELLRNARHLQVLTPIHSRAREQVILAAGRMAAKLKWVRLDIWRTRCYREFLILDLGEEEGDYFGAHRHLQLSPAAKTTVSTPSQPSIVKLDSTSSVAPGSPRSDAPPVLTPYSPERPATPDHLSPVPSRDLRRASIPTSVISSELLPVNRQSSSAGAKERASSSSQGPAARKLEREASVQSSGSRVDASSLGSPGLDLATPAASVDGEERILKEAGLLSLDGIPSASDKQDLANDPEIDRRDESPDPTFGEPRGRVRRSLHRTLRDSHSGPHHQRSKKGRDSGSTIPILDDGQAAGEREGLSRKEPNFTVHGKKASVITFGSEWQGMSTEQRLKLRKPVSTEEARASDLHLADGTESVISGSANGGRPQSMRSASTTTARSLRNHEDLRPELPPLDELKKELQGTASDDIVDKNVEPSEAAATSPLSPPKESYGPVTLVKTESNALSGDENPLNHNVSQEGLRHSPHQQVVSA